MLVISRRHVIAKAAETIGLRVNGHQLEHLPLQYRMESRIRCHTHKQCHGQALCIRGKCKAAQPGTGGECDPAASQFCPKNEVCKFGICLQVSGYLNLGQRCTESTFNPCRVLFSACIDRVCKCVSGYVRDGNECVPATQKSAGLGDPCKNNEANLCRVANSACINGSCQCADGYAQNDQECLRQTKTLELDDDCMISANCKVPNSDCIDHVCQCVSGYQKVGNECHVSEHRPERKSVQDTDQCRKDIDCPENGLCVAGQCRCPRGFVQSGDFCQPTEAKSLLGGGNDEELRKLEFPHIDVSKVENAQLGANCSAVDQCMAAYSMCIDGKCACRSGYDRHDGTCQPSGIAEK
ncbi:unnamed protein product [Soboliphyme baturini]|uniref:EB domain-containing protein n=1 Tax=Soboliphyme baturini TaxID=241478 RepID=A0A183IH69_9BILA|nr:unnamed protein product [Soboliphyme baturini]